jgi:hypothetical protein
VFCGNNIWSLKKKGKNIILIGAIKFIRGLALLRTRDRITNEHIRNPLRVAKHV